MRLDPRAAIAGVGLVVTASLSAVYVNEGGHANHKADRGGETIWGITEKTARSYGYKGAMRDFPKHCTPAKPICADLIYRTSYIDRPGYKPMAAIEPAVFFELVDSAVLHGPPRASGWFQGGLNAICGSGLQTDGVVGPKTIAAYRTCQDQQGDVNLCLKMLETMDRAQLKFFEAIVARDPSQRVFLRGWVNKRVGNVPRAKCIRWDAV